MARVWGVIAIATVALAVTAGSASAVSIPSRAAASVAACLLRARVQGQAGPEHDQAAAEPVHGREPEQQHPQRHVDDRRLPPRRAARQQPAGDARSRSRRRSAARSTFDTHGRIVSVCPSRSPRRRPGSSTRTRWRRSPPTTCPNAPDPPGTKTYQNFTGGGYFFLDSTGPDLGRRPRPTTSSCSARSPTARSSIKVARLRPDRRARRVHRADHLGAARLQRPDLVRLEEERQGRHARPARPAGSR